MRNPPLLTFLLAILGATTTGTALGRVPLPGSLQDTPSLFGQVAAILVCGGSWICASSMLFRDLEASTVVNRMGLVGLFFGSAMYCYALATVSRFSDAAFALGVFAGLALGSAAQWIWLLRRMRKRIRES